ncbi:ChbG/HpnK family deacetylase [Streptococcus merionis]|uniref:ChbG/HpnK family deacetylase n=1 Tax=Streptococcus merionis TaxID=400065 RepID=UPI0026F03C9D|nr:ChbG/HpnK family deacetylase [Streptococcus merionis]
MTKKLLIVNADDFGMTVGVSQGILKAMQNGLVTETCAIVNSPYFEASVKLAKEAGLTKMGVHLNVTVFTSVSQDARVLSLTEGDGQWGKLVLKRFERADEKFLEALKIEFEAQIAHFLKSGLILTHLNTHHGLGMQSKAVLDILEALALTNGVPLRREDTLVSVTNEALNPTKSTELSWILDSSLSHEDILKKLNSLSNKANSIELCCHPGLVDDSLKDFSSMLSERERDLALLTNSEFKLAVKERFELIDFGGLIR